MCRAAGYGHAPRIRKLGFTYVEAFDAEFDGDDPQAFRARPDSVGLEVIQHAGA